MLFPEFKYNVTTEPGISNALGVIIVIAELPILLSIALIGCEIKTSQQCSHIAVMDTVHIPFDFRFPFDIVIHMFHDLHQHRSGYDILLIVISESIVIDVLSIQLSHLVEQMMCNFVFFPLEHVHHYVIKYLVCLLYEIVFISDLFSQLCFYLFLNGAVLRSQ